MSRKRIRMMVTTLALTLGAGACATGGGPGARNDAEQDAEVTLLEVENDNWQDVNVYMVRGVSRFRLGTVTGNTSATFEVPATMLAAGGELRLMADPIGSRRPYVTEPIPFARGNTVIWRLGTNLAMSNYAVY